MDHLDSGLAAREPDSARAAERSAPESRPLNIVEWLHMARGVGEALPPVQPRPEFRALLHEDLMMMARRSRTERALAGDLVASDESPDTYLVIEANSDSISRRLIWGAAVGLGSAVSVISVMAAYYWRRRGRKPEIEPGVDLDEIRKVA